MHPSPAVKPPPSIFKEQQTVLRDGSPVSVQVKGRHDPVIVPRAVVVVEAMTALKLRRWRSLFL